MAQVVARYDKNSRRDNHDERNEKGDKNRVDFSWPTAVHGG
jgi:hypothetical protein